MAVNLSVAFQSKLLFLSKSMSSTIMTCCRTYPKELYFGATESLLQTDSRKVGANDGLGGVGGRHKIVHVSSNRESATEIPVPLEWAQA
jgi:hypothetical protein